MIKKSILSIILFLALTLCKGQVYFNRTYSSNLPDSAYRGEGIYKLISINDSEYVFNMFSDNVINGDHWNYIVKTNINGGIKKTTMLGYPNHQFWLRGFIQTSDGNYILSGTDYDFATNHATAMLMKLDSNLDTVWNKFYNVGQSLSFGAVEITEIFDNGFVSLGNRYNGTDTMDVWVLHTDSAGNYLWDTTFAKPYWQNGYSIVATDDSCVILACLEQVGLGGTLYIRLVKMDSNKNIIWQKNIYGTDAIGIENLTKLSNNNYLGSGGVNYGWSTGFNDFYAVLIKFDNAGNIIKSKTYDKTLKQTEFWNSIENSDGTIISAGNIYDTMPGNHEADGYIVKLDSALDTIWTQTVKMDDTLGFVDYFFNIFRSHDGGFVCTGMRNGPIANNTDGWVIKFDSLGCPIANCWLGSNENIDVNEAPLLVYPNPTEHGCIVRYPHHGPLLVDVYDNAGRKIKNVRTWPFGNTEYYVDLHNAPSGILLLRINYGNNVISTKIIKK